MVVKQKLNRDQGFPFLGNLVIGKSVMGAVQRNLCCETIKCVVIVATCKIQAITPGPSGLITVHLSNRFQFIRNRFSFLEPNPESQNSNILFQGTEKMSSSEMSMILIGVP